MQTTSHAYAEPLETRDETTERALDLPEALGAAWVNRAGPRDLLLDAVRTLSAAVRDSALDLLFATPLYPLTLHGPLPDPMVIAAVDPRPGRVAMANLLFTGQWTFAGATMRTGGRSPWRMPFPSEAYAEEIHGFAWLRHFRSAAGETAQSQARALVTGWLERYSRYHALAWQPHVTARRIASWLANGKLIWEGADVVWRCAVLRNLAQQARHLARTARHAPDGAPRLVAAIGLILSGVCLSEGSKRAERGLALLDEELDRQILPDGGHVSRDPALLVSVFADLIGLQATIEGTGRPVPEFLRHALDRMAPMVRMLRHGDGRLALFNGGDESAEGFIDNLLARSGQSGVALPHARHAGYHRLEAGRTVVIMDTGAAPRGRHSSEVHGGPLAFEMSVGAHRVVVNCGPARHRGGAWRRAARATAAHSTLSIAECPTSRMLEPGHLASLLGERVISGPKTIKSASGEGEEGRWLWTNHDAYVSAFGLLHERRLFLDSPGRDLRGEDRLMADPRLETPAEARSFTLRFHLHPDVRASLARDGRSVLILLPNGDGWRFRAMGGKVALEDSIYLGRGDAVRKAEQITVTGETDPAKDPQASVKWAFQSLTHNRTGPLPKPAE